MQSQNPTPVLEEAGKASSRHSWFKCLQARQKTILGNNYTQKAPAGSQQHLVRRWKAKWRGEKKHLRWEKTSSASQAALTVSSLTQRKSKEHHAREGQTTSSTVHFFVGHFEPYRYKIIQHMGMGLNLAYDPIWYYMIRYLMLGSVWSPYDLRQCLRRLWRPMLTVHPFISLLHPPTPFWVQEKLGRSEEGEIAVRNPAAGAAKCGAFGCELTLFSGNGTSSGSSHSYSFILAGNGEITWTYITFPLNPTKSRELMWDLMGIYREYISH